MSYDEEELNMDDDSGFGPDSDFDLDPIEKPIDDLEDDPEDSFH